VVREIAHALSMDQDRVAKLGHGYLSDPVGEASTFFSLGSICREFQTASIHKSGISGWGIQRSAINIQPAACFSYLG
jgi:hypothetical protein